MNPIIRAMWGKGLTLRAWALQHGFPVAYTRHVVNGDRGRWGVGISGRIVGALIADGFIAKAEDLWKGSTLTT